MRLLGTGALFMFVLLLAACGGGGTGHITPPVGASSPAGSGSAPTQPSQTHTTMLLRVPPVASQNSARRPFYISPNTKSFGVFVAPAGSSETPSPSNAQIFPVATPSPCAAASGGGETCTLTVTAPIGNDVFYVAAFAVASPNVNSVPLSDFESGVVNVGGTPNPNATPLSFSLNGVVDSIALAVPSPDPGNTPNTQVFTAGSPAPGIPLGITAYDSSGNIILADPSIAFDSPVLLNVTPSNMGVSLTLNAQCPGSASTPSSTHRRRATSGPALISIACAADLGNVSFSYDGTVAEDTNDHIVDNAAIAVAGGIGATPGPTPSPAFVVLQSNITPYAVPLPSGSSQPSAFLTALADHTMLYVVNQSGDGLAGIYTPATNSIGTPTTLNGITAPISVAVAPNGTLWMIDEATYTMDCWPSVAVAVAGQAPAQTVGTPTANGTSMSIWSLSVDNAGNVWYVGYDDSLYQNYAGYFPASSGCVNPGSLAARYTLSGDSIDASNFIAPLANGIAYNSEGSGLYVITTTSASSVSPSVPAVGGGSSAGGIVSGSAGTTYAAYSNSNTGLADIEGLSGSALSTLAQLAPTAAVNGLTAYPSALASFSVNGGPADRFAYADSDFNALGQVWNPSGSTSFSSLVALPNVTGTFGVAYENTGNADALYLTSTGIAVAREAATTTWNVPVTTLSNVGCGNGLLSIDERGDSGPFTIGLPSGGTVTPFPGSDHDFEIFPASYGVPFPATITDAHGRTETYSITVSSPAC